MTPDPYTFEPQGRLIDFMRQADNPDWINLAAGIPAPDSLPSKELGEAMMDTVREESPAVFAYHHPEGDHALKEWLASDLARRGVTVTGDDIVMTTGCHQALQLMISLLVKPGDIVACEVPTYYGLLEILSGAQARILPLQIRSSDGIDLNETADAIEQWKPRFLIVCSSLSNPTGATMSSDSRRAVVDLCRNNGVRIIEDDIYAELVEPHAPKPMRSEDDGSVVSLVTSFSKTVSPGLRIGYCIPGSVHEAFATLKCKQDMHSAVPTEASLRRFLQKGFLQPHLHTLKKRYRHLTQVGRETVRRVFPEGTLIADSRGGYMLWVAVPQAVDQQLLRERCRSRKVAFGAGRVFFPNQVPGTYFRLNCARAPEADLIRGIEILGESIQTLIQKS